jgi:hypothetical protein
MQDLCIHRIIHLPDGSEIQEFVLKYLREDYKLDLVLDEMGE